jgi:hypothetical protein
MQLPSASGDAPRIAIEVALRHLEPLLQGGAPAHRRLDAPDRTINSLLDVAPGAK